MKNNWIDFKALRTNLNFEQVLRHFSVEVKRKGAQHHGFCPLPAHNGKRNSPSFSANLERGIFQCFGCGAKGNVLDFAAMMQSIDPKDGAALRKVAGELQQRFCPAVGSDKEARAPVTKKQKPVLARELIVKINPPLDFELKNLDPTHPYLLKRGFTSNTIRDFGLGFCSRGMLKDRIAIPLHDNEGNLVGYAGRAVNDSAISEDNPRYRFPGERKRDDVLYEFRKTAFLYNGFQIKAPVDDLIVVEGFTSAWWLHQNGMPMVVGTMGADCSDKQAELIVSKLKPNGRLWVVPDADAAGERQAASVLTRVGAHRFVRWIRLEPGKQPTDYPAQYFQQALK